IGPPCANARTPSLRNGRGARARMLSDGPPSHAVFPLALSSITSFIGAGDRACTPTTVFNARRWSIQSRNRAAYRLAIRQCFQRRRNRLEFDDASDDGPDLL